MDFAERRSTAQGLGKARWPSPYLQAHSHALEDWLLKPAPEATRPNIDIISTQDSDAALASALEYRPGSPLARKTFLLRSWFGVCVFFFAAQAELVSELS